MGDETARARMDDSGVGGADGAADTDEMDDDDDPRAKGARAILVLLSTLPELGPVVDQLANDLQDDLTAYAVFSELAGITSNLLVGDLDDEAEERLERIFGAIETVATSPGVDTTETVAFSFFDQLTPLAAARAEAYLGPATEEIYEDLLAGLLELG